MKPIVHSSPRRRSPDAAASCGPTPRHRQFYSEFISLRPSPTCRIPRTLQDIGDLAALKLPSAEAVSLIKNGLQRERAALEDLTAARRDLRRGISRSRSEGASWWAISVAILPGGGGRDPHEIHRARLEMAKRLRQRAVI